MDRQTVNALLTGMLESADGVSDLLFIAGKPPLVEVHGRLSEFPIDTPDSVLAQCAWDFSAADWVDPLVQGSWPEVDDAQL